MESSSLLIALAIVCFCLFFLRVSEICNVVDMLSDWNDLFLLQIIVITYRFYRLRPAKQTLQIEQGKNQSKRKYLH